MNAPNLLSCVRIGLTAPAVWAIIEGESGWATTVLVAALLTDFFDGWLARRQGVTSELGKILDPVADKIFVAGALIALVQIGKVPLELALVVVLRDVALLSFAWIRIRGGSPVPSARITGKVAFAVLGTYLAWEVAGTGWPAWVPAVVGSVYLLGSLVYVARIPGIPLGRILKELR